MFNTLWINIFLNIKHRSHFFPPGIQTFDWPFSLNSLATCKYLVCLCVRTIGWPSENFNSICMFTFYAHKRIMYLSMESIHQFINKPAKSTLAMATTFSRTVRCSIRFEFCAPPANQNRRASKWCGTKTNVIFIYIYTKLYASI